MNLALTTFIGLYTALMVVAPIMSNRLVELWHFVIPMGGLFAYAAASILDVINNNWGVKQARATVLGSLINRFVIYGMMLLTISVIPIKFENPGFEDMVLTGVRLLIAAEISSALSQYFIDIPIFDYMKKRFKWFAARYNVSNLISGFIQSVTFVYIGFVGTPKAHLIPTMIISGVVIKYIIQISATPIVALLAKWTEPKDVRNT